MQIKIEENHDRDEHSDVDYASHLQAVLPYQVVPSQVVSKVSHRPA